MNGALLTLAAAAVIIPSAPAFSQSLAVAEFSGSSSIRDIRFVSPAPPGSVVVPRFDGRHGRHIRVADALATQADPGYLDPGDYDANRSFDPDRWNDWWHDRPDRAYPRWMSRNRDCARPWYSGDVLTC
jgi:hypothetical protein